MASAGLQPDYVREMLPSFLERLRMLSLINNKWRLRPTVLINTGYPETHGTANS